MRTHIRSTPLSVSAGLLVCLTGLAVTMLPAASAPAADDCVAAPNAAPPAGQHWWYRTDRATRKKCWYLGPQDQERAARKADRQERAQERAAARDEAADDEKEPAPAPGAAQTVAPAAAAQSGISAHTFALGTTQSVPHIVNWAEMLEGAGIISSGDNTATAWADDTNARAEARAAWAQERQDREPVESAAGKDESRAPQTADTPAEAGGNAATTATATAGKGVTATLAGIPVSFIAILLIACGIGPAIFSLVRALRRRSARRQMQTRPVGAFEGALPPFLQQREDDFAPAHGYAPRYAHEPVQENPRGYGGEDELRRILDGLQRRAA